MKRFWQIGNIVSLLFALLANVLVGAQLLDVPAINDVSDTYATLLTPASYAFSIWSLIYLLLVIFVIYQARDLFRPQKHNRLPEQIGPLFMIASLCNGLWTYVFVSDFIGLSVAILVLLSACLYLVLNRLKIAIVDAPLKVIVCVWWPLLLYTGWVTIATVVNIASYFQSIGITFSTTTSAVILIVVTAILAVLVLFRNVRELALASGWGIAAIGVQQVQLSGDYIVATTAFTCSGILLAIILVHGYVHRQTSPIAKLTQ